MKKIKLSEGKTQLEKIVIRWLNSMGENYDDGPIGVYHDLQYGGCQSGIVSELITYTDTTKFFKKHRAEISQLLAKSIDDLCVQSPAELFRDKWDKWDSLALDSSNQNLLAWFGFEETANRIMSRLGIE